MKPSCPHCGANVALRPHRCSTNAKGDATSGQCTWRTCSNCHALIGPYSHYHPDHDQVPALCPTGVWPKPKVTS